MIVNHASLAKYVFNILILLKILVVYLATKFHTSNFLRSLNFKSKLKDACHIETYHAMSFCFLAG